MFAGWLKEAAEEQMTAAICEKNEKTARFGLTLTKEEAGILAAGRMEQLREQQRVEFGEGILPRLIDVFCDSPYLYQDNYVETLERLQEIFYLYKNESMDVSTDEELLEYMKESFDGECQGSLTYLEGTALEAYARKLRADSSNFFQGRIRVGKK